MNARDITVQDLQEMLRRGASVRILDIRAEEDHREWSIPGSEHLPWPGGAPDRADDPVDCGSFREDGPVVVVCDRGRTSRPVARELGERCGVDARSLEGGMAAWSSAWNAASVSDPDQPVSVLQLRRTGKGCLSYLLASRGEALVVDPFGMSEDDFVARLASESTPTPPNDQRIIELNEEGTVPSGGLLELEAGANRCAAG